MFRTYRNWLTLLLIFVTLGLGDEIDEAIRLFNNFKFDEARAVFQEILKKQVKGPRTPEIYFYLARLFSEPESTVFYYEHIIAEYPESRFCDKAYLELAKISFAREDYNKSIILINTLKEKFHESIVLDQALFWLGLAYMGANDKRNGVLTLKVLIETFPNSPWASRAKSVMQSEKQPTEGPKGDYTIQIGSFRSLNNVQKQIDQLKEKGLVGEVSKFFVGPDTFYRVWVGNFKTHEEAKAYLIKLDSLGYKGNVVKK